MSIFYILFALSETMALNIFHFVQERIEESREKLITDKKKIPIWSKRMHLGLKAYKVYTCNLVFYSIQLLTYV